MIDWEHSDSIADLREKVSTLRAMLRDAHRREDARLKQERITEAYNPKEVVKYIDGSLLK